MSDKIFYDLALKMNKQIQGVPKSGDNISPSFIEYLKLMFSPGEAELAIHLNSAPWMLPAVEVAKNAGVDEAETKKILEALAGRGSIMKLGESYGLHIIANMLNILMYDDKVDETVLKAGELYQEYFIKDEYYRSYESGRDGTAVQRVIPLMEAIPDNKVILASEDAHRIVDDYPGDDIAFQVCPCRSRTEKLGIRECKDKFPVGYCVVFGFQAVYINERGLGKKVTKKEAKDYIDKMVDLGLVISTDNHSDPLRNVICLCCNCCCSLLRGITRWDNPNGAIARANYIAHVGEDCAACGTCEERCPVGAITVPEDSNRAAVNEALCLGCGVCTAACPTEAITLERFEREKVFSNGRELFRKIKEENKGKPATD